MEYEGVVKVRDDRIQAYLNGRLIAAFERSDQRFGLHDSKWALPDENFLGLAVWNSSVRFYSVIDSPGTSSMTKYGRPAEVARAPKTLAILFAAITNGTLSAVGILARIPATLTAINKAKLTPLAYAKSKRHWTAAVEALTRAGAKK